MTTQHVPHKPLWRKFLSLPQTATGCLAVGLAGIALALTASTNVMGFVNTDSPLLSILGVSGAWGQGVLVPLVFFTWILSALAGVVVALIALLRGQERSALVWVAIVPGLPALLPMGWIILVVGSGIPKSWAMVVLAGLIGVLISWLRRTAQARGATITPEGSRSQPGTFKGVGPGAG